MLNKNCLTAYWIRSQMCHAPIGFGVTARSIEDALQILRVVGYGIYLPGDLSELDITEEVRVENIKHESVLSNMGPFDMRGIWFPFSDVGVPAWAEERLRDPL